MAQVLQIAQVSPVVGYLRPGRLAAAQLRDAIASHRRPCDGLVIDPTLWDRQSELSALAAGAGIDTVLDPRSLELASAGGRSRTGVSDLSWFTSDLHTAQYLLDRSHRHEILSEIAAFAVEHRLSAVLAPTHFVEAVDDPWLDVDDLITTELRRQLNPLQGGTAVRIYRPVYVHSEIARNARFVDALVTRLTNASSDAIWLGVHPFGTNHSGPLSMRHYVDLCVALHRTGLPLIGMHTGTVGVLLMALGALSGIESGVTNLEAFDLSQFGEMTMSTSGPNIGATPRIYIQSLGMFMTEKEARAFFGTRGMTAQHICQTGCCRRGIEDTYKYRINHFVTCRKSEVDRVSSVPAHLRPKQYLDDYLRPACDRAIAASRAVPSLVSCRRRLDSWRQAMTGILEAHGGALPSIAPTARFGRSSSRAS